MMLPLVILCSGIIRQLREADPEINSYKYMKRKNVALTKRKQLVHFLNNLLMYSMLPEYSFQFMFVIILLPPITQII